MGCPARSPRATTSYLISPSHRYCRCNSQYASYRSLPCRALSGARGRKQIYILDRRPTQARQARSNAWHRYCLRLTVLYQISAAPLWHLIGLQCDKRTLCQKLTTALDSLLRGGWSRRSVCALTAYTLTWPIACTTANEDTHLRVCCEDSTACLDESNTCARHNRFTAVQ